MQSRQILLAMSGGVDSSVAAHVLIESGYKITGLYLCLYDGESHSPAGDMHDAQQIADYLHFPLITVDANEEFHSRVIKYFCAEFKHGRTPNPCIVCNEHIKFKILYETAIHMGVDRIATGHYARVQLDRERKRFSLKKGLDKDKEQSYMLFSLQQHVLAHVLFPLGALTKRGVRQLATKIGLPTSCKKDSQEICFVGEKSYNEYLLRSGAVTPQPGFLVDCQGHVVGTHNGIHNFTIGQRRGLCGGRKHPAYVKQILPEQNTVIIAPRDQLYAKGVLIRDINWVSISRPSRPIKADVKLRYRQKEAAALIIPTGERECFVRFSYPQWAVTPGQAAVFYDGDTVLGGGWIHEALDKPGTGVDENDSGGTTN